MYRTVILVALVAHAALAACAEEPVDRLGVLRVVDGLQPLSAVVNPTSVAPGEVAVVDAYFIDAQRRDDVAVSVSRCPATEEVDYEGNTYRTTGIRCLADRTDVAITSGVATREEDVLSFRFEYTVPDDGLRFEQLIVTAAAGAQRTRQAATLFVEDVADTEAEPVLSPTLPEPTNYTLIGAAETVVLNESALNRVQPGFYALDPAVQFVDRFFCTTGCRAPKDQEEVLEGYWALYDPGRPRPAVVGAAAIIEAGTPTLFVLDRLAPRGFVRFALSVE